MQSQPLFERTILRRALIDALRKLDPRQQIKNPVMFVVEVGALLTSVLLVADVLGGSMTAIGFNVQIMLWLWFTVLFANFAEAMAEGRGKAQADALRKTRTRMTARRLINGQTEQVPATQLKRGDLVVCEAGDIIPGDGEITEGPRWTRAPSPASQRRSSVRAVATAARLPAARAS
jgi:K+-transporting ATPase ATPase B chain